MNELNYKSGEVIFHCYKNGEWVDTFGARTTFDVLHNTIRTDVEDLSNYDEVRIIELEESDSCILFNNDREVDENYSFETRIIRFMLPDGTSIDVVELIDEVLDWDTFDLACDGGIFHYKVTKFENTELDDDDLIEDDEDFGW